MVLALVAGVSFGLSLFLTYLVPAAAFFSLPTRAWQLALGGLVALTAGQWRRLTPRAAAVTGWTGLAVIVLACTWLNANTLYFDETAVVEVARNQGPVDKHIGYDVSAALTWRPMMSQNIVLRASYATLLTGDGFDALFPGEDPGYFLLNAIFSY